MCSRRPSFAAVPDAPIAALNTTPLIDVMLVLLIMFIVTIPMMTHSVKLDLPTGRPDPGVAQVQRLDLDSAGRLYWEGAPIAEAALPGRLRAFQEARPDGQLHFRADAEARYEDFDRILAAVKRSGVDRLGLIDNHLHLRALER